MTVYNLPRRTATNWVSSVDGPPVLIQHGIAASKVATAYTFIPCDLPVARMVDIAPLKYGSVSDNGVVFFTTTGGWQIDSLDALSAITDLDAYSASTVAYIPGNIVSATPAGGVIGAYVCLVANTSSVSFDSDLALGYWMLIPSTQFIKITHTAASSAHNAVFAYRLTC